MTESIFFSDNTNFISFGYQHLLSVTFYVILTVVLIKWAKKGSLKTQILLGNIYAFSIAITVVVWSKLKIVVYGFDIQEDIPLHLCNLVGLLLPVLSITRKKIFFEIFFFWILAGTTHAVITPDLEQGFPHFTFLKYWHVHAGLISFIFYARYIYNFTPNLKSVFKSFFALQLYIALMFVINKILGTNYFYTYRKPDIASALDYLGEWPVYIVTVEIIMIPYFLLFYLPFYLAKKKQ